MDMLSFTFSMSLQLLSSFFSLQSYWPWKDESGDNHTYSLSFGSAAVPSFRCIHHAFVYHASLHPHQCAVTHHRNHITYSDLDQQSQKLALYLRAEGIGAGDRVCLLLKRSIPMVTAIIGVMKSGASYIPLDGGITTMTTLKDILDDAKPAIILYSPECSKHVQGINIKALNMEDVSFQCWIPQTIYEDMGQPEHEAYVIYTSGTTGKPKGVSVTHENVTNLICLSPGNLSIQPGVKVAQLLNVAFDMCAWEILGCLANGGELLLRGSSRSDWTHVLKQADVVIATPSILSCYSPEDYPNIKTIAVAGERCPVALADRWSCSVTFWNCCGPTEVTIVNTMHQHIINTPLPIGRPTPNNSVYILNENLRPVKVGQAGMIWAGGKGVSAGYLNLPDLTQERFKPDPFNGKNYMYNTGDIGCLNPDGTISHLGRIDDQVKVKGFRVELDGVAAAMSQSAGVELCSTLLIDGEIWGFYSPSSVYESKVKDTVSNIQPYYAVPSHLVALDKLPLTKNGKIDKLKLRELAQHEVIH